VADQKTNRKNQNLAVIALRILSNLSAVEDDNCSEKLIGLGLVEKINSNLRGECELLIGDSLWCLGNLVLVRQESIRKNILDKNVASSVIFAWMMRPDGEVGWECSNTLCNIFKMADDDWSRRFIDENIELISFILAELGKCGEGVKKRIVKLIVLLDKIFSLGYADSIDGSNMYTQFALED
jgi:hypothetical protein